MKIKINKKIILILCIIIAYFLGGTPISLHNNENMKYEYYSIDELYHESSKYGTCHDVLYYFSIVRKCDGNYVDFVNINALSIAKNDININTNNKELLNPLQQVKHNIEFTINHRIPYYNYYNIANYNTDIDYIDYDNMNDLFNPVINRVLYGINNNDENIVYWCNGNKKVSKGIGCVYNIYPDDKIS